MTTEGSVVPQIKADQALIDDNYNYEQNILKVKLVLLFNIISHAFAVLIYTGSLFQVYFSIKNFKLTSMFRSLESQVVRFLENSRIV